MPQINLLSIVIGLIVLGTAAYVVSWAWHKA